MYIYENPTWPHFTWNQETLLEPLANTTFLQGEVLGRMKSLGFELQRESNWHVVSENIISSSEIEGEHLNYGQVRSSVARHLNIPYAQSEISDHHIDGIVSMMFDAIENYNTPLTLERLFIWHASLFPTGFSGMRRIRVGQLRSDEEGRMQVVSRSNGPMEIVHFQAPEATQLPIELSQFLSWINSPSKQHPIVQAAIAHLWFITLHPFDDGNGRLARAITDMMLSRSDGTGKRFYSMSAQIQREKESYYAILEETQKGTLDVTGWLLWFLDCLSYAIKASASTVDSVLIKARFWQEAAKYTITETQRKMLSLLLDDFKSNLTSSKWARICKVSQDTAIRDIKDLVQKNLLEQKGQGRSTHYVLKYPPGEL
jgi:Fic family protein